MNTQWSDQLTGGEDVAAEHAPSAVEDVAEEVCIAEHRITSAETDGEFKLPQPLRQLISTSGVKLAAAPNGTWNIDGFAAKLHRNLSVTLSIDSIITSEDVLEAFYNAGIDACDINSIQYRGSNHSWCVSFRSKVVKVRILEIGFIHFGNVAVFLGDADFHNVIVKVYDAPPEMPDTVVIWSLSHYGRVLSFRRDHGAATRVLNGVRTGRMRRFALPARSYIFRTPASPRPAGGAVRRATWRRDSRSPAVLTVKLLATSRPIVTWPPLWGVSQI